MTNFNCLQFFTCLIHVISMLSFICVFGNMLVIYVCRDCSTDTIFAASEVIATEVRATWNGFSRRGIYHTGLSCFSPVINIMRHPLWGRNQVCY